MQQPRYRLDAAELRRELEEEAPDELGRTEHMVIQVARHALGQAIRQYAPPKSNRLQLTIVAIAGMFSDVVAGMAAPGRAPLLDVINERIAGAGFEIVATKRN